MKITDCLNIEHDVFLAQLLAIEGLLRENAPLERLRGAVTMLAAGVAPHAEIEETRLYPALRAACGDDFPQLVVMEAEHEEFNNLVASVRTGAAGNDLVARLAELLRDHIMKERRVLFPLAEARLGAAALSSLCAHEQHCGCGCEASAV